MVASLHSIQQILVQTYSAQAIVAILNFNPSTFSNSAPQASRVEPVVTTSSTNITFLFISASGFIQGEHLLHILEP